MNPGANADGKLSEKVEAEDNLRTVECLRGRLLAERVASRNAKEEAEQMENKLIELEKKLIEEYKSRNRAEKKLKFLMKKLQSMNIPYISCESEQSGSGSVERSEISSVVSSATSSSTKEVNDKENNVNSANSAIGGNTREFIQNSKLLPVLENLQQSVSSSIGIRDNPAAGKTNCSSDGVNSPELTIQKEEIEEFKEKTFESPTASNNPEQNAYSFARNQDSPASQKLEERSESSSVSNNSEQNSSSSAEYHDKSAAGEGTGGYGNGVNFSELTVKIETESPIDSIKYEQNASSSSSSAEDYDTPAATATATATATETVISTRNSFDFPDIAMKKDEIKAKNESPAVSIEPAQNNNQCQGNPKTQQEIDSHHNEPQSSQRPKKHDRSLRSLFKKEKLDEENGGGEQDDQVDNSLALVPVELPKPKQQSIDPVILDATVKEVLGSLRNAKEKLQTSMERRRSNMIKVG